MSNEEPSCCDIFFKCQEPHFERCQCCAGLVNIFFPGSGLCICSICCYGCFRPSCCGVMVAGASMFFTCFIFWGWIVAIIVGVKMMCPG
ncbi:Cysteine-rich membrane protein 2 [Spironucleus salmonicida]|uniref:Cysteine-rich membrane protein 2 n=1 Tax=Spironucleus salmonicida TaxID=348837 RepID=V6LVY0_9EUKA|nr:Cysteine-rich membrane protein 2 [Spironucleus salmonicida]|eukprot:EST48403.1 Cysteine-rich membrane protein 2 [Spironucleus salmonicida]